MRIYVMPGVNDSWLAVQMPTGAESFVESTIEPLLYQDKMSVQSAGQFSDFGFAWVALAAIISAASSAASKWKGSGSIMQGQSGFSKMSSYLVEGKYLYCTDDCNKAWRLNINKYGSIDIVSRELTGSNPRFDCALLPKDLLDLIPCAKTKERAKTLPGSQSYDPAATKTAAWPTWATYVLVAGFSLLILSSVGSKVIASRSQKKKGE